MSSLCIYAITLVIISKNGWMDNKSRPACLISADRRLVGGKSFLLFLRPGTETWEMVKKDNHVSRALKSDQC
jgi:hypothetical protein